MEHHTLGCVIFDLDGTLLDSMNVWSQIDRNLLNHYGKTAPDDLTEQVKKMKTYCNGVIVGSAIVKMIGQEQKSSVATVGTFVKSLRNALDDIS